MPPLGLCNGLFDQRHIADVTKRQLDVTDPRGGQSMQKSPDIVIHPLFHDGALRVLRPVIRDNTQSPSQIQPVGYVPSRGLLGGRKDTSWGLPKKIEYLFKANTVDVATNTTLGTSTVYDQSAIATWTIKIAEQLRAHNFLSVQLITSYRGQWTADNGFTGSRQTFKIGSGTAISLDRSHTSSLLAGRPGSFWEFSTDVTDVFRQQWAAQATFASNVWSADVVATVAVSSASASNVNGHTFRLVITYAIDPATHNLKRTKTIRIPIQSHSTSLTTSQQEIGTDGANPAPANQLPQLTGGGGYLKEDGATVLDACLEIWANPCDTASADVTPYVQIDSDTEVARALQELGSFTNNPTYHKDHFQYTSGYWIDAHAFKMRADVTAKMELACAFLVVTYYYSPATTTTVVCEAIMPFEYAFSGMNPSLMPGILGNQCLNTLIANLEIAEGVPTLARAAAVLTNSNGGSPTDFYLWTAAAPVRTYTPVLNTGQMQVVHRLDQNNGLTLSEGINQVVLNYTGTTAIGRSILNSPVLLVHYTATIDPAINDPDAVTRLVDFLQKPYDENAWTSAIWDTQSLVTTHATQWPPMLGGHYSIVGALLEFRVTIINTNRQFMLGFEMMSGDGPPSTGTQTLPGESWTGAGSSFLTQVIKYATTKLFTKTNDAIVKKLNAEKVRRQFIYQPSNNSALGSWSWQFCISNLRYHVSGTVMVDGVLVGNNHAIKIFAVDPTGNAEYMGTAYTDYRGIYDYVAHDGWRMFFAMTVAGDLQLGRSYEAVALGVPSPGGGSHDIDIKTAVPGGGSNADAYPSYSDALGGLGS